MVAFYQKKLRVDKTIKPFNISVLSGETIKFIFSGEIEEKELQKERVKPIILEILKEGPYSRKEIEEKMSETKIGRNAIGEALLELEKTEEILSKTEGKRKKIYFLPQNQEDEIPF